MAVIEQELFAPIDSSLDHILDPERGLTVYELGAKGRVAILGMFGQLEARERTFRGKLTEHAVFTSGLRAKHRHLFEED